MMMSRTVIDSTTGEISQQSIERRCGTRLHSECEHCSTIYKREATKVLQSGVIDESGNPLLITMLTLTAPSSKRFGKTHTRIKTTSGKYRPCYCGEWHDEASRLLGLPIDPDTYDYTAAAEFNRNATRLFAVTLQKLNRVLGRSRGNNLRVARVVEYQRRGLVHIHALVVGRISQDMLNLVVRGGVNPRTGYKVKAASSNGWQWGPKCDASVRPAVQAAAYVRKVVSYAVKDTVSSAGGVGVHASRMSEAGAVARKCECFANHCAYGRRVVRMGNEYLYIKNPSSLICRRRRSGRKNWGFTGHVLSKTRNWPMTFGQLREARRQYAMALAPTTLVPLSPWSKPIPVRRDE